jgi:TatD DNase family protein
MIDTHVHLEFPSFKADLDEVIKRSFDKGLSFIINVGGNIERNKLAAAIAGKYPNIYAVVGIHPEDCDIDPFAHATAELKKIAGEKKIVGIGEAGLDYHSARADKEIQKDFFEAQIAMAAELKLPLVVHIRDAYEDALKILKEKLVPRQKFVVHCYSGSIKFAKQILI